MTRRATHTLEFKSNWTYDMSDVEGKRLPELKVTLDYLGWDENRLHFIEGRVKLLYAGDVFLEHLPAALKRLQKENLDIEAPNKRDAIANAMQWADELIAEFMASGLFAIAELDATGLDRGVYEYEPVLQVVEAKVFKVK